MTASTEAFLALQRLYRERAEADAAAVEARARALLKGLGREPGHLQRSTARLFAKNARNLRCAPRPRLCAAGSLAAALCPVGGSAPSSPSALEAIRTSLSWHGC